MLQRDLTASRMRARLGVSGSSPISAQVLAIDVGAARTAPRLRASRSQLQRNNRPVPLPPWSATTSGQARSGV